MNLVFKALSHPVRRQIVAMLQQRPLTSGEIAEMFDMAWPSVTGHLTSLKEAGLVEAERQGNTMRYRLNISAAEEAVLNPLFMRAHCGKDLVHEALAINEVSLLRAGAQAARLRISVDGRVRMAELVCDGALVSTPAGSTAYNYSAHGPILPIGSDVLALTAVAAFRPRRWRGALLPKTAEVTIDVLEPEKRPVMAEADARGVRDVRRVHIRSEPGVANRVLFDPGHGLEERLLQEQFV